MRYCFANKTIWSEAGAKINKWARGIDQMEILTKVWEYNETIWNYQTTISSFSPQGQGAAYSFFLGGGGGGGNDGPTITKQYNQRKKQDREKAGPSNKQPIEEIILYSRRGNRSEVAGMAERESRAPVIKSDIGNAWDELAGW